MSVVNNITVIKHSSLWIGFSYFYLSGLTMALTLSIDAQAEPSLVTLLLHAFLFNCLVGHLITKYETRWPYLASIVISLMAVVGFGLFFIGSLSQYSDEMNLGLVLLLPFATYVMDKIKDYAEQSVK